MFPDPSVVIYACVSRITPTATIILADFNAGNDPDIEASAVQCVQNTPPHHSIFSHTIENRTYTYLIDKDIVFFCIFDMGNVHESEQGNPLIYLTRVKQKFDYIFAKRKNRAAQNEYMGLKSAADELFREPLGLQIGNSRGVKGVCIRFLGLAMCVVTQKRKKEKQNSFGSDAHSDCALMASSNLKLAF